MCTLQQFLKSACMGLGSYFGLWARPLCHDARLFRLFRRFIDTDIVCRPRRTRRCTAPLAAWWMPILSAADGVIPKDFWTPLVFFLLITHSSLFGRHPIPCTRHLARCRGGLSRALGHPRQGYLCKFPSLHLAARTGGLVDGWSWR
jgi:hypothetical protein